MIYTERHEGEKSPVKPSWQVQIDEVLDKQERKRAIAEERKRRWEADKEDRREHRLYKKRRCHICKRLPEEMPGTQIEEQDVIPRYGTHISRKDSDLFQRGPSMHHTCEKYHCPTCKDHLHRDICAKCGSKPRWWPSYRWNPFPVRTEET